ncbi:MAG: TIGR01212 family radical SAM protein [Gammaproteobacteria bacterium]|nr:TIGR01212 family radical SAM protein [Gammaproteobacteria bacterium]
MALTDYIHTFGSTMQARFGERVHKVSIDAGFTCPNIDGSKGRGGCTFCNNISFSPHGRNPRTVAEQIESGRQVIRKRTGAQSYIAYFQAYTNTYADPDVLDKMYREALDEPDVVGLSIGTRPDCVPDPVLDLLAGYREEGYEIWLELGLQSAFDETLDRVNRLHYFSEYRQAVRSAQLRGIQLCTHLIAGLPGEDAYHYRESMERVLELGTDGFKFHPLHVVKGTMLANEWRSGDFVSLTQEEYVNVVVNWIEQAPNSMVYHRLTATASEDILLDPAWCSKKWLVLNAIEDELARRQVDTDNLISQVKAV